MTVPNRTTPPLSTSDLTYGTSTGSRRRAALAALLALVVLLGGVAALTLLRPHSSAAVRPPSGPAALPPPSTSPLTSPSPVAPLAAQPPLTAAPTEVTWELFQGVALPVSTVDGPTRVSGPVHAGFSRTPTGALLADAQIGIRRIATPNIPDLREIAEQQLVEGPGKIAYLNLIASLTDNDPPAAGYTQIAAFRFITYSPDVAVISIATRDRGRIQVGTDTLRWIDGDWKLDLPPDGLQHPQLVTDLAGYVRWQGVS